MRKPQGQEISIVGVSLGNSYFTEENIKFTLAKLAEENRYAVIMITDVLDVHNNLALGYKEAKAKTKSRLDGNALRKKVAKTKESLGLSDDSTHVLDWNLEVEENEIYKSRLKIIQLLYNECVEFKNVVDQATQAVLSCRKPNFKLTTDSIREGVNYLLKEFAYLDAAAEIYGVEKVTFVYHKEWGLLSDYISGKFDGQTKSHMDFRVIDTKNSDPKNSYT